MKKISLSLPLLLLLLGVQLLGSCKSTTTVTGERIEVGAALDTRPNSQALAILEKYQAKVKEVQAPVLGTCAQQMENGRPESLLSNLAADVLLQSSLRFEPQRADLAIMNEGGLRNLFKAGPITVGDVYKVFPFENTLCLLTLTGAQLQTLFAQIAAVGGEGISGARLVISKEGKLQEATVGGKPIQAQKLYRIATLDYLAEGNDGLGALREGTHRVFPDHATIRQLVTDYIIQENKAGRSIQSKLDGRITLQ